MKLARFATSALEYKDVDAAVDLILQALQMLSE
jgi:hypothetical protein